MCSSDSQEMIVVPFLYQVSSTRLLLERHFEFVCLDSLNIEKNPCLDSTSPFIALVFQSLKSRVSIDSDAMSSLYSHGCCSITFHPNTMLPTISYVVLRISQSMSPRRQRSTSKGYTVISFVEGKSDGAFHEEIRRMHGRSVRIRHIGLNLIHSLH
jgi:hypothetical protein